MILVSAAFLVALPAFGVAQTSEWIVTWAVVPLLLVALEVFAWYLASLASKPRQHASNIMAIVLGFILWVTVIALHQWASVFSFSTTEDSWEDWWKWLSAGLIIGGGLLYLMDSLVSARTSALFIVIIHASSLSALYFYLVESDSRSVILLTVLGMLVGAISYALMFPGVLEKIQLIESERGRSRP